MQVYHPPVFSHYDVPLYHKNLLFVDLYYLF